MVERSGKVHDKLHDVRCTGELKNGQPCNRILFQTRCVDGKRRLALKHEIHIQCSKCGLLNKV